MAKAETFVEFLLEDLELLLVHADSNSIAMDRIQLVISLCEDLKSIKSLLKEIPESFSENDENVPSIIDSDDGSSLTQNNENFGADQMPSLLSVKTMRKQVKFIKKKIFDVYIDSFFNTTGKSLENSSTGVRGNIGSRAEINFELDYYADRKMALLERLTGGPKELEVITHFVMDDDDKVDLSYHRLVINHFDVHKGGTMHDRNPRLGVLSCDIESMFQVRDQEMGKGMYNYLKGKRYLIEISVYGGICNFGVWDDLKTSFPNDGNGSKILVSHYCKPFFPRYSTKNKYNADNTHLQGGTEENITPLSIKVRYMASELFQSPELVHFAEKMNSIKKEALQVFRNGFPAAETPEGNSVVETLQTESNSPILGEDIIVGFDDEELELLNRLTGLKRQREVILIAGMAGIGKTTMAKRLYKNPHIVNYFHVRAWASVSQVYQEGNVFHELLLQLIHGEESLFQMSDEAKGDKLYKCLKGKKYLIVIDDIWDNGVWDDLKMYFPDDQNGSKVLMTSRITDVALNPGNNCPPHCLRFLSKDESWDLFERKVFGNERCPQELMEMGKKIVAKCKGLPLAVVVVSGLISKKEKTREWWWHIAENIGSYIDKDAEQFMNVLELSYKYLPHRLKSCFVYLRTFPEDYEIPVRKLIRLWIAQGFIQHAEEKRLEDIAENYLLNLVDRSLVIVSKRRSDGGMKTCLVHDMLRNLCIRKAHQAYSSSLFTEFLFGIKRILPNYWYRLLTVLDLRCTIQTDFPWEVLELIRLKYLALYLEKMVRLPPAILKLWNLETLNIDVEKMRKVTLPENILKMVKLRHLLVSPEIEFETPWPSFAGPNFSSDEELSHACPDYASYLVLHNLQTISSLCPSGSVRYLLTRFPNVRTLGFHITLLSSEGPFNFFDLSSLNVLEKMKFEYQTFGMVPVTISSPDKFPSSLKRLTLVGSHVNWEEMSIIGMLPNLEVLKVKDNFFSGPKWETCEGGFQCLKFLKFSHMDLQEWIASDDNFPRLERLVLNGCLDLAEIPSAIGDICTLQVIEVHQSNESVTDSARKIQESQRNWGNHELKVFIYHDFEENISK